MAEIEYDSKGMPIVAFGVKSVIATKADESKPIKISTTKVDNAFSAGKYKGVPWYDDNDFPQTADNYISTTPVLKRSISDMTKITLGQGLFPCKVIDIMQDGREVLEIVKDIEIRKQLNGYKIRRYLGNTAFDLYSYGNAFVQLIPNLEGNKIITLNPVSALKSRLEKPDDKGKINNLLVSGYWPNDAVESNISSYILLDEIDPMAHLIQLRDAGILKSSTVFLQLKSTFSSNDFYSLPSWYSAIEWVKIANKIPKLLNAGYDNVLNILFFIKIPYSYFEKKYPEHEFQYKEARQAKIDADVTRLEEKFTTVENARKALITFFSIEENDEWKIDVVQPKYNQENVINSTAADTQIAIGSGISPDLLGLMYGNSKGGSMQRELLLLHYALSWHDREQIAEPIEMMLKFNQPALDELELRFRNTFLTTLDTGKGTASTLS